MPVENMRTVSLHRKGKSEEKVWTGDGKRGCRRSGLKKMGRILVGDVPAMQNHMLMGCKKVCGLLLSNARPGIVSCY